MRQRGLAVLVMVGVIVGSLYPRFDWEPVHAGGPVFINLDGIPYRWDTSQPVPFTPDQGELGVLSNPAAVSLTTEMFQVWTDVPTAVIQFQQVGQLDQDITGANVMSFLNTVPDTVCPVLFDTDGSITDAVLGAGARVQALGFAAPTLFEGRYIRQAIGVLNGLFIDGRNEAFTNPEVPLSVYRTTFIHEFGHYIGLDHSALNTPEAFDGNPDNDSAVPTMFPQLATVEQSTLHLDDEAAVSALYPTPEFPSITGVLRGRVRLPDGSGFQGINVIARNVAGPKLTALSSVSGYLHSGSRWKGRFGGTNPDLLGLYEIIGLPPGTYTLEVSPINRQFRGGSGVGPVDPPVPLSGVQFYTGPGQPTTTDPAHAARITVLAGAVLDSMDIPLTEVPPVPRTLSLPNAQGRPGETVKVSVNLTDGGGVAVLVFFVSWNQAILSLTDPPPERGTLVPAEFSLSATLPGPNQALIVLSPSPSAPTAALRPGSGTVVTLTFRVAASARPGDTSPLTFSNVLPLGADLSFVDMLVQNGTLRVVAPD